MPTNDTGFHNFYDVLRSKAASAIEAMDYEKAAAYQQGMEDLLTQYRRQHHLQPPVPGVPRRPEIVNAFDAHLTEEGLVIEVDAKLRVRIPPALLRRVGTLVTMAELANLLPEEPPATP